MIENEIGNIIGNNIEKVIGTDQMLQNRLFPILQRKSGLTDSRFVPGVVPDPDQDREFLILTNKTEECDKANTNLDLCDA